jgi:tight adherence protein B
MSADSAVLELAGLLRSGMPAERAREELSADLEKLTESQSAQLEVVWALALAGGGSISEAIESLGEAFRSAARQAQEIELAFAGPRATARLVGWLPAAGLALAQVFGLNPFTAILTNFLALLSLLIGVLLLFAGHYWAASIIRKAAPSQDDPGLYFDSIRYGVLAGLPLLGAIKAVDHLFSSQLAMAPDEVTLNKLDRMTVLNRNSGASISGLLAAEAKARREAKWFSDSNSLAKLSVKLMIPLGVVTLPAFVLSAIVPVAISLLSSRQS